MARHKKAVSQEQVEKSTTIKIVADPTVVEAVELSAPKKYFRAQRFGLAINTSYSSSPEYALALQALKKSKVMLPLFKFYMDELIATGMPVDQLVLNHKEVNANILKEFT